MVGKGGSEADCMPARAISAVDPPTILAGTRPSAVFRSPGGVGHWDQLTIPLAKGCPTVGILRVKVLRFGPVDSATIWLGVGNGYHPYPRESSRPIWPLGSQWEQAALGVNISAGPLTCLRCGGDGKGSA